MVKSKKSPGKSNKVNTPNHSKGKNSSKRKKTSKAKSNFAPILLNEDFVEFVRDEIEREAVSIPEDFLLSVLWQESHLDNHFHERDPLFWLNLKTAVRMSGLSVDQFLNILDTSTQQNEVQAAQPRSFSHFKFDAKAWKKICEENPDLDKIGCLRKLLLEQREAASKSKKGKSKPGKSTNYIGSESEFIDCLRSITRGTQLPLDTVMDILELGSESRTIELKRRTFYKFRIEPSYWAGATKRNPHIDKISRVFLSCSWGIGQVMPPTYLHFRFDKDAAKKFPDKKDVDKKRAWITEQEVQQLKFLRQNRSEQVVWTAKHLVGLLKRSKQNTQKAYVGYNAGDVNSTRADANFRAREVVRNTAIAKTKLAELDAAPEKKPNSEKPAPEKKETPKTGLKKSASSPPIRDVTAALVIVPPVFQQSESSQSDDDLGGIESQITQLKEKLKHYDGQSGGDHDVALAMELETQLRRIRDLQDHLMLAHTSFADSWQLGTQINELNNRYEYESRVVQTSLDETQQAEFRQRKAAYEKQLEDERQKRDASAKLQAQDEEKRRQDDAAAKRQAEDEEKRQQSLAAAAKQQADDEEKRQQSDAAAAKRQAADEAKRQQSLAAAAKQQADDEEPQRKAKDDEINSADEEKRNAAIEAKVNNLIAETERVLDAKFKAGSAAHDKPSDNSMNLPDSYFRDKTDFANPKQQEPDKEKEKRDKDRRDETEQDRIALRQKEEKERLEREEKERTEREEKERAAREENERAAREENKRAAREEKERAAREENERAAREEKERAAREENDRAAREEKERAAREENDRAAREENERAAREEKERAEQEEKEQAAREEKEQAAREEKEQAAREEKEQVKRELKERAEQEEKERAEQEEKERAAREERERAEREERELAAREEKERAEQEEKERAAREERERAEREEKERAAREERERAEREEKERAAREERERAEREETERQNKIEELVQGTILWPQD